MNEKKTSWGSVAGWYDELLEDSSDSYQEKVILPNVLRLVDSKPGMTIADIACGQGYFSRAFQAKGAVVIGSDISDELIALAKERSLTDDKAGGGPTSPVAYHVSAADSLPFIEKGTVDVATIILALQNIENMQGTLNECARILKPGGKLILVMNHPAFRILKRSSWQWDEKANAQYRRIDGYMSDDRSEIDMNPGATDLKDKKTTVSFHRPLQAYFKALNKAGFAVSRLEEWISHKKSQEGPRAEEEDRMRKEIPMFLMVEAEKI